MFMLTPKTVLDNTGHFSSVPSDAIPAATTSTAGAVKIAAAQANSTATDVAGIVTDFNALLVKLRAAGIISS